MPVYLKAPPPPPPPIAPWTGFYAGPHAGYGFGTQQFFDNFPTPDGALDASPSVKGALGGLQAGYNRQFGWLVLGVEGDFSWSGVKDNFTCFSFGNQVCSAQPEWFGSIAGRLGIAYGPALFYVKGGAAFTHDHFTDLATCSGSQPTRLAGITAACGDPFDGGHGPLTDSLVDIIENLDNVLPEQRDDEWRSPWLLDRQHFPQGLLPEKSVGASGQKALRHRPPSVL